VPALRAAHARLGSAALALVVAAAVAIGHAATVGRTRPLVEVMAIAAVGLLVAALAGAGDLLWPALLVLGIECAVSATGQHPSTPGIVASAAAVLVVGELASWSLGLRAVALLDRRIVARRAVAVGLTALGACVLALAVLAAPTLSLGGLAAAAVGVAATVALVAVVAAGTRTR
jgi:hypothetical protein